LDGRSSSGRKETNGVPQRVFVRGRLDGDDIVGPEENERRAGEIGKRAEVRATGETMAFNLAAIVGVR
jgi:hypothetical protein